MDSSKPLEQIPGVLVVQIKDDLDFGTFRRRFLMHCSLNYHKANTSQLKGDDYDGMKTIQVGLRLTQND